MTTGEPVELTSQARRQGVYVIGTTGCGKTTLLQNLAYQDMCDPHRPGLCVLDPHGDFIDELLRRVPEGRRDDVILFDPGSPEQYARPLGLNLLACDRSDPKQVDRVSSTVIDTLKKLFLYSWGPRMEDLLRHSILTLMETPDTTLLDLLLLLASPAHRKRYTHGLSDPLLRQFWEVQFAAYDRRMRVEVVGSSLNKIGRFLANPLIRNIVSQPHNSLDMRQIMDEGKILLVNLSKGDLGEDNCFLLGAVLVNLVLIAALQRREIPQEQRRPFHLIVDEFQNFATDSFATLQSEARKYAVDIIVAHQYRDQLDDLNQGSTLNVANVITMRVSGQDSPVLASQFDNRPPEPELERQPMIYPTSRKGVYRTGDRQEFVLIPGQARLYSDIQAQTANHLTTQPNFSAQCRLVGERGILVEYALTTLPPLGVADVSTAVHIRSRSQALGQPRQAVETAIADKIGEDLMFDDPHRADDRGTLTDNEANDSDLSIYGDPITSETTGAEQS
jgi:energy-coupling factor transporter ATP-binding protein EcfA2